MATRDHGRRALERCPRCYEIAPCTRCGTVAPVPVSWRMTAVGVGFMVLIAVLVMAP